MNLTTDRSHDIAIVRIGETRIMYPLLQDFSAAVAGLQRFAEPGRHDAVVAAQLEGQSGGRVEHDAPGFAVARQPLGDLDG